MNHKINRVDLLRLTILLLFLTVCMSCFVFSQPFGDGPDEINRYKVVSYIAQNGTIPRGDEPTIIIDGYGASYAFQPILTYMLEGFLLHLLSPLNLAFEIQLIIARYVNVLFGLIAAVYTYKLSNTLFSDRKTAYLFTLGVTLLPQNIFVYTYVNTDGMALMSCTMIMYALVKGFTDDFSRESIITLTIGVVCCLLSYYNCYSFILVAVASFILYYLVCNPNSKKDLWKKFGIVAGLTFIFAGWWFIRNIILYNGDFLALKARSTCAQATGNWYFLEQMAETYKAQGYSVFEMVFRTDYYTLVWKSFIGMFGPMLIPTSHHLYMAYKYLTVICLIGYPAGLLCKAKSEVFPNQPAFGRSILITGMTVISIITIIINIIYSYSWDFQPQGRYYLPMLLPLAFLLTEGLERLLKLAMSPIATKFKDKSSLPIAFVYHLFYMFFFGSAALSILIMLKYYAVI